MKILSLKIENILSIEDAHISFEDKGIVLVEGWNHDTSRANGAGKTAIFNALSFALYDKIPRKVTASEILRRGCKSGRVECVVQLGEEVWTITRSRPKGVTYCKGETPQLISQEEWEAKIRLSYDQFLMSMYTAQNTDKNMSRFLMTSDSDKKSFLLQLLNLDVFDVAKKAASDKISSINNEINKDSILFESNRSKVQAYSESLVDEKEVKQKINKLSKEIESLKLKTVELSTVKRPDLSKFTKLEDDIRNKLSSFAVAKSKKSQLHDKYRETLNQIKDFDPNIKCGECGSNLATNEAKQLHLKHQEELNNKLSQIKTSIDELDETLSKETSVKDLLTKLKEKKNKESFDYDKASEELNELNMLIKSKTLDIQSLTLKLESNDNLLNKINTLNSSVDALSEKLANNKKHLEIYKTITTIFSPTGAQAYILDSIVDFFNEAVSEYISLLWPTASYTLTSYKETSKGDVTAKFSEILTMDGKEVSVGSLSGGELKALSLCVDFAILDVLESQFGINLNPIILDEPFDGLDNIGRELVIELLEKLAVDRQIFVIDHTSEAKSMFSKVIKVEKRGGVSRVSVEA